MARGKKKEKELTVEERLEQALVPAGEQPYSVPENWCWTHLGYFIDFATDYVANGSFASLKNNVPIFKEDNYAIMVKTADFANGFTHGLTYTNEHGYNYLSKSALFGGELILSNIGSIGKVFRVPYLNRPMTLASNSVMIKCFHNSDYDWLYYYFLSPFGFQELLSITTGTAVLKFNKTDLKSIILPVPPKSEQQRIVDHIESLFAKLDEAKEKAQAIVDGFEARKAAILYKAFSGELSSSWRNANGISDITWHRKTLQDVCSMKITDGTHKTPVYCEPEQGVPFLSAKDVTSGSICWDNIKYIIPELHEELYSRLAPQMDDILLAKNGTTGIAALVETEDIFDIYVTLAVLRPDKDIVLPKYLLRIINSPICKKQFDEHLTGIGVPNLHLRDIKNVQIVVPSLEEQAEIVSLLDGLLNKEQQAKEAAEAVLDQIETMKKTILARAFRGELGTNDPAEESAKTLLQLNTQNR